ncbi:phage tail protein [Paenibacillus gorillae]|uniref:phage tail protein n=1 Tax=Paenibacillus gorillae TaxID=1243662 RepID=UPI0004BBDFBE|nr:tail fiber protein [Paenibacillus gorillae]
MDPYIGEIRIFAGQFAPSNWMLCQGQLLSISRYSTLYSIIGVQYGGDGRTTFALPDFRERAPMSFGQGRGLADRSIGEMGGSPSETLLVNEIPSHTHVPNSQTSQGTANPANGLWTVTAGLRGPSAYATTGNVQMNPSAVQLTGGSQPHNNMQPYLSMNFIICINGDFPQRQ